VGGIFTPPPPPHHGGANEDVGWEMQPVRKDKRLEEDLKIKKKRWKKKDPN
jgi:hypothetical protein